MPSYLHPRSRSTSTLFTTTLAVSFLVVSIPHVLPCPVDRRQFADSATTFDKDGNPSRPRRRRTAGVNGQTVGVDAMADSQTLEKGGSANRDIVDEENRKRACPVPKPGSLLGSVLSWRSQKPNESIEVVVQPMRRRTKYLDREQDNPRKSPP